MPIIRGRHHFDGHFTQIPNAWLRDNRLSYKARGLLAELLTHSPGFEVSRERLSRSGQDGDRSLRTAIAELESVGYLKRSQSRSRRGQLGAAVWVTSDPDGPSVRFAPADNAPADNVALKNTEIKNTEIKKEEHARQVERDFEEFWKVYPRRVGKIQARKAFEKAWSKDLDLVEAARKLANDPNLPAIQYVPHATTWLNRAGWEDEPYPVRELTAEEKQAKDKALAEKRRQASLEETAQRRAESEKLQEELRQNPVKRCEHDRIIYMCKICSKTVSDQEK